MRQLRTAGCIRTDRISLRHAEKSLKIYEDRVMQRGRTGLRRRPSMSRDYRGFIIHGCERSGFIFAHDSTTAWSLLRDLPATAHWMSVGKLCAMCCAVRPPV